ncbi:MAG: response regulator transcription factor [Verrucomicrobiota bacterium]
MVEKNIRLLIVDDHAVVRMGLTALLGRHPQMEVVGEANSAAHAVTEAARLKPEVVLMDVRLPDSSGFEACRKIRKQAPNVRVLFLTSYQDDDVVVQAISAGADGFLLKDAEEPQLVAAIESIHAGRSILDPAVVGQVLNRIKTDAEPKTENKLEQLSTQERRVIALVAQGKTNKEIGQELVLSDKTIKNYLSNAMDKLQMKRRSQAAAYFVQQSFAARA